MTKALLLTPEQFRMAKAALGWNNVILAKKTGLHRNTINDADHGRAREPTLALLKISLEAEGVIFIDEGEASPAAGQGVRLKK